MGHAAQPLGDALTGRVRQRSFASSARNGLVSNIVLEQLCSAAGIPRRRRSSPGAVPPPRSPAPRRQVGNDPRHAGPRRAPVPGGKSRGKGRGIGSAASVAFLRDVVSTGRRQSRDLHRGFVPVCPPLARGVQRRP